MLLHYFGSKDSLIAAVMQQAQAELQLTFQSLLTDSQSPLGKDVMQRFWKILSNKRNRPIIRLLFEIQILALQNPKRYRRYLIEISENWRGLIARVRGKKKTAAATLYNAVIDGLLLELLSTGDLRRTSKALAFFTKNCRAQSAGPASPAERGRRSTRS
jgi:AcrR family transcriptional regulator